MGKLGDCHFLFNCVFDTSQSCMQTAEAASQKKQEVVLTQLRLTIFKYVNEVAHK